MNKQRHCSASTLAHQDNGQYPGVTLASLSDRNREKISEQIRPRHLVDSAEGRHIYSLPPDGTSTTDTGGVLTGSTVDDGIHQDLKGVLGITKEKQLPGSVDYEEFNSLSNKINLIDDL